MKLFQYLALFFISILLSSCGLMMHPSYLNKGYNGPIAKIGANQGFSFGNGNIIYIPKNPNTCTRAITLNAFDKSLVSIPANKPLTIVVLQKAGYNDVLYGATFLPKQNHIYRVNVAVTKPKHSRHATLNILDVTSQQKKRVPFVIRQVAQSVWTGRTHCTDTKIIQALHRHQYKSLPKVRFYDQSARRSNVGMPSILDDVIQ